MTMFYDFKIEQEFNPMKGVKSFFISPLIPGAAILLDLQSKVQDKTPVTGIFYEGMPVIKFPLKVLNLGECTIEWESRKRGVIYNSDHIIYFSLSNDQVMMITGVFEILKLD